MKILNIVNVFFTIPYFLGNQLAYFTKKGYEIHLICSPANQLYEFAKKQGCKYKEIVISREFGIISDVLSLVKIFNYVRRNKFDVVCGHTPKAGMIAMIAAWLAGVKNRIYFRHGLVYETAKGLKKTIFILCERVASACSTTVVCVSPYLVERSIKDNLTSSNKLVVLMNGSSNGVDTEEQFNPDKIIISKKDNIKRMYNIPKDAFVIGFVGRLVNDKGINELIDAYRLLKEKYTNIHLFLVGPLEERDGISVTLKEYINQSPNIHHAGLIEEDIEYMYSNMDILVLPTHREGLGMALLEAQSMRIPVLAPSHTGSRDALINGKTGQYICITPESIAEKIEFYLLNPIIKKEHGEAGRLFVKNSFKQELIWKEIEERLYLNKK